MRYDEILTREDVAELIGIKPDTARKWGNTGRLPSHKVGNKVFFMRSEIMKWIKQQSNENLKGGLK